MRRPENVFVFRSGRLIYNDYCTAGNNTAFTFQGTGESGTLWHTTPGIIVQGGCGELLRYRGHSQPFACTDVLPERHLPGHGNIRERVQRLGDLGRGRDAGMRHQPDELRHRRLRVLAGVPERIE